MAMNRRRTDAPTKQADMQSSSHALDRDETARRAYQRYEGRGREDGHDVDDWLEAERDLERHSTERREEIGRDGRIRTGDPLTPSQVR